MITRKTLSNDLKIIIAPLITLLILVTFTHVGFASPPASCTSNSCFSIDNITFNENSNIFHFGISAVDGFIFGEHGSISASVKILASDLIKFSDSSVFRTLIIKVVDTFKFIDFNLLNRNAITTVTTFITETVNQLVNNCSGSSCYQNPNATGMEAIAEDVIFPLMFIVGTVFGFLYMGIKFFGISVMIATFIILGLAYIGIIPSYFTLLSIVAVAAALTKMIRGMIGGSEAEA